MTFILFAMLVATFAILLMVRKQQQPTVMPHILLDDELSHQQTAQNTEPQDLKQHTTHDDVEHTLETDSHCEQVATYPQNHSNTATIPPAMPELQHEQSFTLTQHIAQLLAHIRQQPQQIELYTALLDAYHQQNNQQEIQYLMQFVAKNPYTQSFIPILEQYLAQKTAFHLTEPSSPIAHHAHSSDVHDTSMSNASPIIHYSTQNTQQLALILAERYIQLHAHTAAWQLLQHTTFSAEQYAKVEQLKQHIQQKLGQHSQ
ncbi:MAG: hypothetical protein Q4D05_03740 [Acinetobacter sp.]|nr:hypothetical protein [Acinetobacter sp.]